MRSKRTDLRERWAQERRVGSRRGQRTDAAGEWRHLERAHVLSQPMAGPYVRTHVAMLGYGLHYRNSHEVVGQLVRLVVAAPGTWTGRYPVGNTGGANVKARKSMPIPDDFRAVLGAASMTSHTSGFRDFPVTNLSPGLAPTASRSRPRDGLRPLTKCPVARTNGYERTRWG